MLNKHTQLASREKQAQWIWLSMLITACHQKTSIANGNSTTHGHTGQRQCCAQSLSADRLGAGAQEINEIPFNGDSQVLLICQTLRWYLAWLQNRGHFSPATVSFFAPGKATRHRVRKHTILPCFRPINAVPRMAELQPSDEVLNYQTVKKQFLKGQLSP